MFVFLPFEQSLDFLSVSPLSHARVSLLVFLSPPLFSLSFSFNSDCFFFEVDCLFERGRKEKREGLDFNFHLFSSFNFFFSFLLNPL